MFGILGTLTVDPGDGARRLRGTPKQRTLLALLLTYRRQTVSLERMVDEIWSSWPPASATANVRTYLSGVRAALGSHRGRLVTRPGGYLLDAGDGQVDADHFATLAEAGRRAIASGEARSAIGLLRRALGLWRGRALDDVPLSPSLLMHSRALEEQRLSARDDLMRAQMAVGDYSVVAMDARRVLAANPTRESTWHLLVSALHESGDPRAALEAYGQARRSLADLLGLEPGPKLVALHRDVLRRRPVSWVPH